MRFDRSHSLQRGLTHHFLRDQRGGTEVRNIAAAKRGSGTLTNMEPATDWVIGVGGTGGYGLDFDGVNDYVLLDTGDSYNVDATQNLAASLWFKTTDDKGMLLSLRNPSDSALDVFCLCLGDNGATTNVNHILGLQRYTGGSLVEITATKAVNDGEWHHVIIELDQTDKNLFSIILDGILYSTSQTGNGTMVFGRSAIGVDKVWLDTNFRDVNARQFTGEIRDVRIYKRALTVQERFLLFRDPDADLLKRKLIAKAPVAVTGGPFPFFIRRANSLTGGFSAL